MEKAKEFVENDDKRYDHYIKAVVLNFKMLLGKLLLSSSPKFIIIS